MGYPSNILPTSSSSFDIPTAKYVNDQITGSLASYQPVLSSAAAPVSVNS